TGGGGRGRPLGGRRVRGGLLGHRAHAVRGAEGALGRLEQAEGADGLPAAVAVCDGGGVRVVLALGADGPPLGALGDDGHGFIGRGRGDFFQLRLGGRRCRLVVEDG